MNAFASSSTSTLSAVRNMGSSSLRPRIAMNLLRSPSLPSRSYIIPITTSNNVRSLSTPPSSDTFSSITRIPRSTSLFAINPNSVIGLMNHLSPILSISPSAYILRRTLTTSASIRATPSPTPKPSRPTPKEEEPEQEDDSEPDPNLSAYARLKLLFKRYGWYALGMYTVLSALDFSLCFVLIHLAGAERIEPLLAYATGKYRTIRYGEVVGGEMNAIAAKEAEAERVRAKAEGKKKDKSGWMSRTVLAEMALAYPIHKVALLPVRAGLTVAWTPKFVGWLTRRGWVGKGGYTRAASHAQDKIRVAKDRVKERVQDLKQ